MEKITVPISKSECSGCSACVAVCPVKAITMKEDEEGFLYPIVDNEKCIKCGLCKKKCSFINEKKQEPDKMDFFYIARHNNDDIRLNSRSGGIFVSCSDFILEQNGIVYGCILDKNNKVIHARATNKQERDKMCKSKYVQSDVGNTYQQVKDDLENDKKVLFSGTGCQISGLLTYLEFMNVDTKKLYTIDIVCHGCVSPKIFEDFKSWLERKYHGKIEEFNFRDKTICGWDGYIESAVIDGKKYKGTIYREIFQTDAGLRPSCYNCRFSKVKRASDITIADAWGVKKSNPELNDNKGISMFIIQSDKGRELLEKISKDCIVEKVKPENYMQPNLFKTSHSKVKREIFWKEYQEKGIDYIISKYGKTKLLKRIKSNIKYKIRKLKYGKKQYLP